MNLCVQNISCGYRKNKMVVRNISFELNDGEVLTVLGPNGSGKTTLFKALLHFVPFSKGHITFGEKDVLALPPPLFSHVFSYIPQHHIPTFSYSVGEMVMMGRASHVPAFSVPGPDDKKAVCRVLKRLNILHLKDRRYTKISGGERKLVLIARALCQDAKIIVMDEPSSDLDYANQQLIANTILSLKREGYGIILSTHANEYPFAVADRVLLLKKGEAVAYGSPSESLTKTTLSKAFSTPMDIFEVTDTNGNKRKMCLPV